MSASERTELSGRVCSSSLGFESPEIETHTFPWENHEGVRDGRTLVYSKQGEKIEVELHEADHSVIHRMTITLREHHPQKSILNDPKMLQRFVKNACSVAQRKESFGAPGLEPGIRLTSRRICLKLTKSPVFSCVLRVLYPKSNQKAFEIDLQISRDRPRSPDQGPLRPSKAAYLRNARPAYWNGIELVPSVADPSSTVSETSDQSCMRTPPLKYTPETSREEGNPPADEPRRVLKKEKMPQKEVSLIGSPQFEQDAAQVKAAAALMKVDQCSIQVLSKATHEKRGEVLAALNEDLKSSGISGKLVAKAGKAKVLLEQDTPFASGTFKKCTRTFVIGGKKAEMKVLYGSNLPDNPEAFQRDVERSIAYSLILQQTERSFLFGRYKKVTYTLPGSASPVQTAMISDYAESGTLRDHLRELKPHEQSLCMRDILTAGTLLEREGIVHRDLKSGNLLMRSGRIVVADFGLMTDRKKINQSAPIVGIGTRAYLPPFTGGTRTDYVLKQDPFAAGLILLEIATRGQFKPATFLNQEKSCIDLEKLVQLREALNTMPDNPLAKIISGLIDENVATRLSFAEAMEQMEAMSAEELSRYHAEVLSFLGGK